MNNITLKDIGKKLGISATAVSKALRDSKDISEETKTLVRLTAKKMGYIPNNIAISLRKGSPKTIAVVINDLQNPFFAALCDIVFKKINQTKYTANLYFTNEHLLTKQTTHNIIQNKTSGVISFVEPKDEIVDAFHAKKIPFTLIGINSPFLNVNSLYTDDYMGGRLVGEEFVRRNLKKALFLTNSFSETSYRRYSGFSDVIIKNQKHVDIIPFDGVSDQNIIIKSLNVIEKNNYDFVFCFSDYLAIKITRALEKRVMNTPVVVFGFDDLNRLYNVIEKTNSVSADYEKIVEMGIKTTINQIESENNVYNYINKMFPVHLSLIKKN